MWPFKERKYYPNPRFLITVDGHGDYRVKAGTGYAPDIDDFRWMQVRLHFKDKVFGNQTQAEKAIMDFEEKLILDVRKVIAEVF